MLDSVEADAGLPIVSFTARSGTGKTTFLEALIPALLRRGVRVMVVKHDVHGFEVDKPGKDSWRLRQAGARRVLLANKDRLALMGAVDGDVPLPELVARFGHDVDLVLSEGYRKSSVPKILIAREGAREALSPDDVSPLIAAVTDHPLTVDVPQFPLDDPEPCADFLVARFVRTEGTVSRELTGVLLAGGASTRMGTEKADLQFLNRPLLPELVDRMSAACSGGVIVVRRAGQTLPALPAAARVVDDLLPERAALGGLFTGLALAETPFVFLAACDMPLLSTASIEGLRTLPPPTADVLLPIRDGHSEPTHAVYGHRCLGAIKRALLAGEYGMGRWLGSIRVERIPESRWRLFDAGGLSFLNVNTPEDLARAEGLAGAER
jgi:molybdopterin-guanine dinucleotide biosynthesis adapter protein